MVELVSPEQRVVNVVKQSEAKASQSKSEGSDLRAKASQASEEAAAIGRIQNELQTQINDTQGIQEARGKIAKIKAKVSGTTKQEQEQLDRLLKQLDEKGAEAGEKEKELSIVESGATKAEKTSRRSETVAEANKRNISKEEERKKPWEERVVSEKATESMKKALKGQDTLAEQIKFYSEHNYSGEPKYTLPIEQVRDLRQRLVEYQRNKKNTQLNSVENDLKKFAWEEEMALKNKIARLKDSDGQRSYYQRQLEDKTKAYEANKKRRERLLAQAAKEADTQIISAMPLYEVVVKQAEGKGQLVDFKQFSDGLLQGLEIFRDLETIGKNIYMKQGRPNIIFSQIGYYGAGASRFDDRFNRYGESRTTVEDKIAYEIGYCAGALIDGASQHLAQHLRLWIAETVPVSDGKGGETKPLGHGYFVNKEVFEIQRTGTRDIREAQALNEANKITSAINEALKKHRLFEESKNYLSGLSERPEVFKEVGLIKD